MLKTRRQFLALARAAGDAAAASGMVSQRTVRASMPAQVTDGQAARLAAGRVAGRAGGQGNTVGNSMGAMEQAPQRQMLNPMTLMRFVDALPIPALALGEGTRPSPKNRKVQLPYYRIEMTEFAASLHRDIAPTRQWGYGGAVPGPTLETRSGQGLLIEWVNKLPQKHFLPVDHTLHGAESGQTRGPHGRTCTRRQNSTRK